ncbi:MAG: hypothetical protein ABI460_12420 [Caldimonas sp.]
MPAVPVPLPTEVAAAVALPLPAAGGAPAGRAALAAPPSVSAPAPQINQAELTQNVLADLQRQIDLMLEVRLREALAPVLARAADALIRDARKELTSALRDAVARSVAQELARREDH